MADINGIKGDMYQIGVVTKYEIIKNLRSKRLYIYFGLIALILALITIMPYIFSDGLPEDPTDLITNYTGFVTTLIVIGVPLFAASALSSEFEERTALLMFTRPIKKESIFIGKFIGSFLIASAGILLYYVFAMIMSFAVAGSLDSATLESLGIALIFVFAAGGFSMLLSSIFKRSTNAVILSIFALLLILPMITMILTVADIKPWFELTFAAGAIDQVIANYADFAIPEMDLVFKYPETGISIIVMLVWGVVTSIIALFNFKRREF